MLKASPTQIKGEVSSEEIAVVNRKRKCHKDARSIAIQLKDKYVCDDCVITCPADQEKKPSVCKCNNKKMSNELIGYFATLQLVKPNNMKDDQLRKLAEVQLYSTPNKDPNINIPEVLNQVSEVIPEMNNREIMLAPKDMKNNKAPGKDGLVVESIKEGITPSQRTNAQIVIPHKKGDTTIRENYRSISLLRHIYKYYTKNHVIRLTNKNEFFLSKEQEGYRTKYGTNDHILTVKALIERCVEYNKPLVLVFVDFKKAFDTVDQYKLLETLAKCRIDHLYSTGISKTARVRTPDDQYANKIKVEKRLRQEEMLSPKLFITVLQRVLKKMNWNNVAINVNEKQLNHLCFADDIVLIADKLSEAQTKLQNLYEVAQCITNLVLRDCIKINDNRTSVHIQMLGI
ncbi:hypothetical protein Trydic_g12209 [Trypoxylus dichotomus]